MPLTTSHVYRISQNIQTMNVEIGNEEMYSTAMASDICMWLVLHFRRNWWKKNSTTFEKHQLENGIWTYLNPHPQKMCVCKSDANVVVNTVGKDPYYIHAALTICRHTCSTRTHRTKDCRRNIIFHMDFQWYLYRCSGRKTISFFHSI